MSGIARALSSLFGMEPTVAARMTKDAVQAAAADAAKLQGVQDHVAVVRTRMLEGRVVWDAGTLTRDAGWSCVVDDETGRVTASGHHSGWRQSP